MIHMLLAACAGVGRAGIATLSGTSGSPNVSSVSVTDPSDATAGWRFKSDGSVQRRIGTGGFSPWMPSVEWFNSEPGSTYYLRATANAGDAPTLGTLNTWISLATDPQYDWEHTTPAGTKDGSVKIEIATDSGGTNIVATGYYGGFADVEPDI